MPKTLIVPGVSVSTAFDVAPPLPARSGVLGAVGVVDDESHGVLGVTTRQELFELYGPATAYSFPEALSALANGISEVVVSPVLGGRKASVTLRDADGDDVVQLIARAAGPWGNHLGVRLRHRRARDGAVRSIDLEVLLDGSTIETHDGLLIAPGHPQDFFTAINRDSRVFVAVDPAFGLELPTPDADRVGFVDETATAATRSIRRGATPILVATASTAGARGDSIVVEIRRGRAIATLTDATDAAAMRVRTRVPDGDSPQSMAVDIVANPGGGVDVEVLAGGVPVLARQGMTTVADLAAALDTAGLLVDRTGDVLPAPTGGARALRPTRTVVVRVEGVAEREYEDLLDANEIISELSTDTDVDIALADAADGTQLPDADADDADRYLSGGRDAGFARQYQGQLNPAAVLDLVPAPETNGAITRFRVMTGVAPATVRIEVGVDEGGGFELREAFDELVMDPDSPNYLLAVLESRSGLLRAIDRYPRIGTSTFPSESRGLNRLTGGSAPSVDAYLAATEALATEDAVDLLLAGLQGWSDPALDGVAVQQNLLGHARGQAEDSKPRIVIGSVRPEVSADVAAVLDHAEQVRGRRFVLVTPGGADGAVAGLLGQLDFFRSPTFKTVASPGVPLVAYRESELNKLVGPDGNVCVVTRRRGRGVIVVKGIATDGSQISVTRVADRCVREVKAIADRFIGELNNDESRNALKQMIHARLAQLERDGALVPSVDGESPAFVIDVYASQTDAAGGIVRIDLAVRPVTSIDYVYATLRVRN